LAALSLCIRSSSRSSLGQRRWQLCSVSKLSLGARCRLY
jgi:hypothetical protein